MEVGKTIETLLDKRISESEYFRELLTMLYEELGLNILEDIGWWHIIVYDKNQPGLILAQNKFSTFVEAVRWGLEKIEKRLYSVNS